MSPLPVSPLDRRVVVPTQLLYSSSTRRGWRHGGCSSQSPQHSSQEKSRSARLDSTDVLNSFVVGSAVANSSSAYFSLLTTERVHTASGFSSSDADVYICVEVSASHVSGNFRGSIRKGEGYAEVRGPILQGRKSRLLHSKPTLNCELCYGCKFPLNGSQTAA